MRPAGPGCEQPALAWRPAAVRRYNAAMTKHALALLLLCPLAAGAADWRYADQAGSLSAGGGTAGTAPPGASQRGMTMAQVRDSMGAPETILEAVGDPPITRWQYPGYVVYFERNRVITVVRGRP